jgi:DNA-binding response OmpR family regulator
MVYASLRTVSLAGKPIDLTTMQFELLWYLAKRSGGWFLGMSSMRRFTMKNTMDSIAVWMSIFPGSANN